MIGIIGGTECTFLKDARPFIRETPYGWPSDNLLLSSDRKLVYLARHGSTHSLSPSNIPYKANICAMKLLGVKFIVALNSVGSLSPSIGKGHIVIPDQLLDFTKQRDSTFFNDGTVAHVSFADPFCPQISGLLYRTARELVPKVHRSGTLVTIEGPTFSTTAESLFYQRIGGSIIGMTTSPEAKLAREAQIPYAVLAYVTDYDSWNDEVEPVTMEEIRQTAGKDKLVEIIEKLPHFAPTCECTRALNGAIIYEGDNSLLNVITAGVNKRRIDEE